jgi:hypothetical protein
MSFRKCLAFGQAGEELVKKFFSGYDELINAPNKKFSLWDFGLRYGTLTIYYEVKRDTFTARTGNICIEFESNGIPSGISLSEADFYIYLVEGEQNYYEIPVDVLLEMIEEKKYHKVQKGGYKWLSHFYLFDRGLFDIYKKTYSESSNSSLKL